MGSILSEGWKLWFIAAIILFLLEGINPGTFALFFVGAGAAATAAACYLFAPVAESGAFQILLFSAMSLFSFLFLRPHFVRLVQSETKFGGPDAFMGKQAKALTILSKDGAEGGRVFFEGTEWAAVPSEDCPDEIPAGSTVEIVKREGLTFQVKPRGFPRPRTKN